MHPKTTVSGVHRLSLLWQRWTVMFKSVSSFKIFFHYTSQDILWWMVSIRDRSFPTMQRQYHKRAVESGNGYHVFAGDTFAYRSKTAECRSLLLWWRYSRKGPCGPFPVSLKKYVCFAVRIRSLLKAMQCSYSSVPCCILRRKDSTICLASISLRVFKRIPTGKNALPEPCTSTPLPYSGIAVVSPCWFNSISSVCTRSKNFCLRSSLSWR